MQRRKIGWILIACAVVAAAASWLAGFPLGHKQANVTASESHHFGNSYFHVGMHTYDLGYDLNLPIFLPIAGLAAVGVVLICLSTRKAKE